MQGIRPGWRRLRAKTSEEDVTEEDDDGKGSSRTDVEWYEGSPPPFLNKAKRGKKRSQDWTESGRQMAVYGVTVHVYRVMRFTDVIGFPYEFYGCCWLFFSYLLFTARLYIYTVPVFFIYVVTCVFRKYYLFVQYHCIWSHYNGDCPGQVVRAMPQPFVPYDYIGDPDLSVIPPPVVDYCCCCVIILPHGGNKFVFIIIISLGVAVVEKYLFISLWEEIAVDFVVFYSRSRDLAVSVGPLIHPSTRLLARHIFEL